MILNQATNLNRTIKDSQEYKQYLIAMQKLKSNPELYQSLNTFRKRNYELQHYDDGVNRYQDIWNLSVEYEKILHNPVVNDFLVAEQVILRKLESVYDAIVEGLEFDYNYME